MVEKKQNHMMELGREAEHFNFVLCIHAIMNLMGNKCSCTVGRELGTVIGIGVVGAVVTMFRKTNVVSAFSENMEKL